MKFLVTHRTNECLATYECERFSQSGSGVTLYMTELVGGGPKFVQVILMGGAVEIQELIPTPPQYTTDQQGNRIVAFYKSTDDLPNLLPKRVPNEQWTKAKQALEQDDPNRGMTTTGEFIKHRPIRDNPQA